MGSRADSGMERERLRAACKAAIEWIARNTPLVDSSDPIYGPIADRADAVRQQLHDALGEQ